MSNTTQTYKEAERLCNLGFAVHWLHPRSKRPVESGWTTGPRKQWCDLKATYRKDLNLGVRLGDPSLIANKGYLAVIDVDVKSTEPHHRKEAVKAARELLGENHCPTVRSGRGNGSRHYYCVTENPFKTWNPAVSPDKVRVSMPSKKPSKAELEELTSAEIKQGIRIANAWEISLYSNGRQVVLPPSIHPDSGMPYAWTVNCLGPESLPLLKFDIPDLGGLSNKRESSDKAERTAVEDFEVSPVELSWVQVPDEIRDGIVHGKNVDDRSGFLLRACNALLSAGLDRNEILTILTDQEYFIGSCAFEHAKTDSRARAALWLDRYTLSKVMEERDASNTFSKLAVIEPLALLDDEAAKTQADEIAAAGDWRQYLEKTEKGKIRNTLNNCKLILSSVCESEKVIGRNEFAANDFYLCDTPWRSKKGDAVSDIDIVRFKFFCAEKYGAEFNDNVINQSFMEIADQNRFHPVRQWLSALRWDGTPRIDTWLKDYAGAVGPAEYLAEVSRKVLCAMVGRVFKPGIKFDHVLILEGLQGVGKSTLLRKLTGDVWFSDATLIIGDKDAVLTMQSKWLIELGELSALRRTETEQLKAFISQTTDRIRAPYGKRVEEFPRQCIFVGSTNKDEYLADITGNRRFWPVTVTEITFGEIEKVRDQLFAEAVVYWNLGEPLYLENSEVAEQAVLEQAKRSQSDEWMSAIAEIISAENFPRDGFEMREVAAKMDQFGAHRLSPSDVHRIGRCFHQLGCEKFRQKKEGVDFKLWRLAESKGALGGPRASTARGRQDLSTIADF